MRAIKASIFALVFIGLASAAHGQQITRIAVVDLNRVIMTYSKDAASLKDFELKKAQIQTEIDRMSEEIKHLQAQKLDAEKAGDKQSSLRIDADIYKKTEFLKEYVRTKQSELDDQAKKLTSSSQFVQAVYRQIQQISETEGYSLVLNLRSSDSVMGSVLWYSPMIDITDKVIQSLIGKAQ
jgi:outer membrane protein